MVEDVYIEKMSWTQIAEAIEKTDILILPTGSTENHGPHLPLQTDSYIISEIVRRAVEKVKSEVRVLVAPLLTIGCSAEHRDFPGTIYLRLETYLNMIVDIIRSLAGYGFKNIFIVNGHGGNNAVLQAAIVKMRDEDNLNVGLTSWFLLTRGLVHGDHAGESETSIILAIDPNLVQKEKIPSKAVSLPSGSKINVNTPFPRMKTVSKNGYLGDPTKATKQRGEEILELASDKLSEYLRDVKKHGRIIGTEP